MTEERDQLDSHEADERTIPEPKPEDRVLQTDELFGERREIWIEHNGERYRLRITRRNKLILQK